MKYISLIGISSGGKSFFFDNYQNYFENDAKKKNNDFPDSAYTRGIGYSILEEVVDTSQVFYKKDNFFYKFKPKNYLDYSSNQLNAKSKIITEDYPEINDNTIMFIRDPRVVWFVDDHCNPMYTSFKKIMKTLIFEAKGLVKLYKYLTKNNKNLFALRFEDHQNNFEYIKNELIRFLEITPSKPIYKTSIPANYYLSNLDYYGKSLKTTFYENYLSDDILSFLNKELEEYNDIFNYKKNITREEIVKDLNTNLWTTRFKSDLINSFKAEINGHL